MPRVSVVIPTRDRVGYVVDSVASALAQSERDLHVLVLDNGERDDAATALAAVTDRRLSVMRGDPTRDVIGNLNAALDRLDAEHGVVFHDDDVMHPRLVEHELRVFSEHEYLAWVGSTYRAVLDRKAMWEFPKAMTPSVQLFDTPAAFVRDVIASGRIGFPSVMYRVAALDGTRLDRTFSTMADRPFLAELATRGGAALCVEPLMNYHVHRGQVTQRRDVHVGHALALMRRYRTILASDWDEEVRDAFVRRSTNELLDAYQLFTRDRPSLWSFIWKAWRDQVFDPRAIRRMGAGALLRVARQRYATIRGSGRGRTNRPR